MPKLAANIGLIAFLFVVCANIQLCSSHCAINEFKCADNVTCILDNLLCDDHYDCPDKSDESNVCQCVDKSKRGSLELFYCEMKNKAPCILGARRCDGIRDCKNGADEFVCEDDPITIKCKPGYWMCEDKGYCIQESERCDKKPDCLDESDEMNCNGKCDVYKCQNGKCLDFDQQLCDGVDDCGDNSDEHHCNTDCTLENGFFECMDELTCLTLDKLCDNTTNCQDGSDEGNFCKRPCPKCISGTCVHITSSTFCQCSKGFALNTTTSTCEDIDECQQFGQCSHMCVNTPGSYNCSCWPDFRLAEDNHTCVPDKPIESWIYYSTRNAIYKYNLEKQYDVRIVDQLEEVVAVAGDDDYVYWTEIEGKNQKVCRMRHNGTAIETIALNGVGNAEGIAIDHWTGNLYFTDSTYKHIVVCGNFGYSCLPVITRGLQKPRAIAIDSPAAKMFWTDWGEKPYIGVAHLDGKDQHVFVDENIHWPNGLAIDYPEARLYWADAKTGTLESIDMNGKDRRMIIEKDKWHVFNVQVLEDRLFWTDKLEHVLRSAYKLTGKRPTTIASRKDMRSLYAYHPLIHKKLEDSKNPCHTHRCGQLCLLTEHGGGRCACSNNYELSVGVNCIDKGHQNLLIGYNNNLYQLEFQDVGLPSLTHKTNKLSKYTINRMTFNTITGEIIIADNKRKLILMITANWVKEVIPLVHKDIDTVSSLAFDYLANNLYWTDSGRHTVELLSLTTHIRTVIHLFRGEFSPYCVVLAPQIGKLFVAVNRFPVLLFEMSLNGMTANKEQIRPLRKWNKSKDDKVQEVAMTIDEEKSLIHIALGRKILSWNYKVGGRNEVIYRNDLLAPVNSFTLMASNKRFFWTGGGNGNIYWNGIIPEVDKYMPIYLANKENDKIIPADIPIVPYLTRLQPSSHSCAKDNGGCSDICVAMGNDTHTCMCAMSRTFKTNQHTTCIEQKDCEFRCLETGLCLSHSKVCDYHPDCGPDQHSSDEVNCQGEHHTYKLATCSYNEFKCDKGEKCLEMSQKCDGHYDCSGGSDELNCDHFNYTTRCHHHQFKCKETEQCVDLIGMCDHFDDCGDWSDEMTCAESLIDRPSCGDLFSCGNGQCIDPSWLCDGEQDCLNNNDEDTCHVYFNDTVCSSGHYQCMDYTCIDVRMVCDGHPDCEEGSDEWRCEGVLHDKSKEQCDADEFRCVMWGDKRCIPSSMVCDGIMDCSRGEDERNCSMCLNDEFACKDAKKCIPKAFVCDKEFDCSDKSDEDNCDHKITNVRDGKLPLVTNGDMFHCLSGEYIDSTSVCNNITDCGDGSDESSKCQTACKEKSCGHICDPTPTGPKCSCKEGYELAADGKQCKDINECVSHPCAQLCENTDGSFRCSCYPNFMLHLNKVSCKAMGAHRYVLYGTHSHIRKMSSFPMHKEIFWQEPHNTIITGMAVDITRQRLYAAVMHLGLIYQIDLNNKTVIKTVDAGSPEQMAVDWGSGNLYIIDGPQIRACNFETTKCVSIHTVRKTQIIFGLQIDSKDQYLFYNVRTKLYDNDFDIALYRSRLDGTKNEIIYMPLPAHTPFALDINRKLIYFVDIEIGAIKEINYEGKQERQSCKGLKDFVNMGVESMAVYQNFVFLAPYSRPYYITATTFDHPYGTSFSSASWEVANAVNFLIVQDTVQPKVENVCVNHGCSKICVPSGTGPKCLCNNGVQVKKGVNCPAGEDDNLDLYVTPITTEKIFAGTDLQVPSIAGQVVLILLVVSVALAGAVYFIYRRRYTMATFSIANSFTNMKLETSVKKDPPPVIYKPNVNRDPESHNEITFDEKGSNSIVVSSTVSDESGEFSDATHLIR